ncbi:Rv3235 family protein [Actinomyces faecalis]|uniref:Rv3235 family protein n=1 Tax=Actinomyces faecalis TaxID=2722820 RepID=UPI001FD17D60|nr:Rv3235 family protein [Actinomyces faecalis]
MTTLTAPAQPRLSAVRRLPTAADALVLADLLHNAPAELTHAPSHPLQEAGQLGRGPGRWDRLRFVPRVEEAEVTAEAIRESRAHQPRVPGTSPASATSPATATRMAQALVTAAAEVLAGLRPVDHMSGWTTPELFDALARRAGLARRVLGETTSPRPRPRRASVQLTPSGACEAMVLLDVGPRLRAAAARLEMHRGRWVLAVIEIG